MASIISSVVPMIALFAFVGVAYVIKLLLDRQHNAKKALNHVWIAEIPKAGKEKNYLVPIEVIGGVSSVRVPDDKGKISPTSPTHILGEAGEFSADYPPGKTKFVQTTVTKLVYYEGDAEPLSNISDRPIISGQLITNMNDGIGSASAEIMKKSMEDSAGEKFKKSSGLLWLYVLSFLIIGVGIANLVFIIKDSSVINELAIVVKQALGVK